MKLEMKDPKTNEVLGVMELPETLLKEPSSTEPVPMELTAEEKTAILNEAAAGMSKENYAELGRRLGYVESALEETAHLEMRQLHGKGTAAQIIETIHESLVNGNRRQMVKQIDEYGTYDFWSDYRSYLNDLYIEEGGGKYGYFTDAVISYFRIKGQKLAEEVPEYQDAEETPMEKLTEEVKVEVETPKLPAYKIAGIEHGIATK